MRYFWECSVSELNRIGNSVRQAIACGKIKPKGCEAYNCNVAKGLGVLAHHEDYDKPLEITWLCRKHHRIRHVEINKLKPKTIKQKQEKQKTTFPFKLWPDDYKDKWPANKSY